MDTKDKETKNEEHNTGSNDNSSESTEKSAENTAVNDSEAKIKELNDKYLRLYSEFDNYRKRTAKERSDLIKTAAEEVYKSILPVMDDFERAIKANEKVEEAAAIKDGINLIYQKLLHTTKMGGLTTFESVGQEFNSDFMEAITRIPAPDESQKGKVIDEVEKGYKLGEKVIRYAKVVVGE